MGLDPLLEDYRYDLKENTGRRALALLLDLGVLFFPMFILNGIFVMVIFQTNPFSLFIGLIAPLVYSYEVYGVTSTNIFVAMIAFPIIHLILTISYFMFLESNGRRTIGKRFLHLEVLRRDGKFLVLPQALQRNILKFVAGALGVYLFGLIGWGLFIGIVCLIDLKMFPGKKRDVRQRFSELKFGTMVFLEDDPHSMGDLCIPGDKVAERKKKVKKTRSASASSSLKPKKKAASLSLGDGREDGRGPEKKRSLLPPLEEKEEEKISQEETPLEEEKEEGATERKVPFWKKLFGGGGNKVGDEDDEIEIKQVPGPDDLIIGRSEEPLDPSSRKDRVRDEVVLQFMFDFDIDEKRAHAVYDMGYRNKVEFKDAIPQDLIMIEGINPTIAKRIVARANE